MTMYSFEIPTTATISFSEFCHDQSDRQDYVSRLPEVTQARANIRATLKEMKATENGGKDYLTLVKLLEEYLPQIQGVMDCVTHDKIGFKSEPIFSWKSTLSSNILKSSRISLPGLHADYAFTLLIYGYALSNLAWSMVEGLGAYEQDRAISDELRKHKDKELNVAVDHLCKASGIFAYIADTVLPAWDVNRTDGPPGFNRPPELIREVNTALSKMVLADAQTLAIRRLQSKSAYESNIAPGPPLPLSHPSPSLLAKLHLECASLYASSRSLIKSVGASKSGDNTAIVSDLRKHLADETALHNALAHKWLGVFAGEKGGSEKGGEAVAFLIWAKKELEELKDSGKIALGKGEKEKHDRRKAKLSDEITSTSLFLKQYKQMNDSVHFQPVPPQSELQRVIPAGTLARKTTPYTPPQPCFGPNSIEYLRRKTEELKAKDDTKDGAGPQGPPPKESPHVGKYSGAGAYF
ncbi:hypothetical protein D9611_000398 [Ephemerocybe angulata]|uniref:pH-response regulator protein palC n=1 Tax=Ephemerocybe angulata TaxID=980116 RepID=A0A8H5F6Q9_9AGAR|nr:hypothetical protein D9611_000398 [Tulosesus angulatus]